jgi:hypothetical protein
MATTISAIPCPVLFLSNAALPEIQTHAKDDPAPLGKRPKRPLLEAVPFRADTLPKGP